MTNKYEYEIYKKWKNEKIFGHLMLQYNLEKAREAMPFRIISWTSNDGDYDTWNEENTEIEIIMEGHIIFEGIRHANFCPQEDGYINYINLPGMIQCFKELHKLCMEFCSSYDHDYYD